MNSTTVSISDVRTNLADLVKRAITTQLPITILQRSEPKAVLVDHNYYVALEEAVLDLTDAREADRAKTEKTLPLSTYLKKRWG